MTYEKFKLAENKTNLFPAHHNMMIPRNIQINVMLYVLLTDFIEIVKD